MNSEEWSKLVEEFKAQGLKEKDILEILVKMFQDGKIDKDGLGKLGGTLGYELSPEFLQDQTPAPIDGMGSEDTENLTKEDIESAKEITPDDEEEGPEEDSNDRESDEDDSEDERDDSDGGDSEDEEEEAKRLFGLD